LFSVLSTGWNPGDLDLGLTGLLMLAGFIILLVGLAKMLWYFIAKNRYHKELEMYKTDLDKHYKSNLNEEHDVIDED
jgi:hypothetical protein